MRCSGQTDTGHKLRLSMTPWQIKEGRPLLYTLRLVPGVLLALTGLVPRDEPQKILVNM
ncbi:hypothetical protein ES703_68513 [subsurface metagenome]